MDSSKQSRPVDKTGKAKDRIKKEETIRMNINLPKSFYKHIKQKALDEETTITELVLKALKKHLN